LSASYYTAVAKIPQRPHVFLSRGFCPRCKRVEKTVKAAGRAERQTPENKGCMTKPSAVEERKGKRQVAELPGTAWDAERKSCGTTVEYGKPTAGRSLG